MIQPSSFNDACVFQRPCYSLAAGSVIHAMGGEQNMRKMGGLPKSIAGDILDIPDCNTAITGVPPFADSFRKTRYLLMRMVIHKFYFQYYQSPLF